MADNSFFSKFSALQVVRRLVLILITVMLVLTGVYAWPAFVSQFSDLEAKNQPVTGLLKPSPEIFQNSVFSTPSPTTFNQTDVLAPSAKQEIPFAPLDNGVIVLSLDEGGYFQLFAYQQQGMPLTRLTSGPWQDIHPALSPDGQRVVFSSNRRGHWDLYIISLVTGELQQLTESANYVGHPSWSPDGKWLVYESYLENGENSNLDLFIQPVDKSQAAIQLTTDLAADHSPAWSPGGRQIVFISTRTGQNDVWLADLDKVGNRFTNLSHSQLEKESSPSWSPDGQHIAWSTLTKDGFPSTVIWDTQSPEKPPYQLGSGVMPVWSPSGNEVLTIIKTPNQDYLTAYQVQNATLTFPIIYLPGEISGVTWRLGNLPLSLPESFQQIAGITPTPPWVAVFSNDVPLPGNRYKLINLENIQASDPILQDAADESFIALRQRVAQETGWDFLGSLEQSYLPLSSPVNPGMSQDWLYTGRAFRFNTAPVNAGWVIVLREDYGAQTYWRIFLRTRFQDGSQGQPLSDLPWRFDTRHSGDPLAYEQGGSFADKIPSGYWFDFTSLAKAFGWERLEALSTWRIAYSSIRYNEFVLREGLDWLSAMLQIYPKQALDTPTPIPPPTYTPTVTLTPTPTLTPTRTPYYTRTPRPTSTPWPTRTSPPSKTPLPTSTK